MVHAQCTVKTDVKFIQRLVSQYSSIYNLNGYVNHTLISFRLVLRFCVEVSYHVYRPDSCFTSKLMKHSCFLTIFIASHTSVQLYPTLLYIIWLLKSSQVICKHWLGMSDEFVIELFHFWLSSSLWMLLRKSLVKSILIINYQLFSDCLGSHFYIKIWSLRISWQKNNSIWFLCLVTTWFATVCMCALS